MSTDLLERLDSFQDNWPALEICREAKAEIERLQKTMPAPDALVKNENGHVCAAMFYYAPTEFDLGQIANEHGFDCTSLHMEADLDEDHPLVRRYNDEGDGNVVNEWEPKIPEGWTFGDKFDTEDGPIALFIKPLKQALSGR
jgi:hypothetical protein